MIEVVETVFKPLREKIGTREFKAKMSVEDRELMLSVSKLWRETGIPIRQNSYTVEDMARMFDRAKRFLDDDKDFLEMIYDQDHVITPLRKIMHAYLSGEASYEESAEKLDECATKVRRLMPELFPEEPLSA